MKRAAQILLIIFVGAAGFFLGRISGNLRGANGGPQPTDWFTPAGASSNPCRKGWDYVVAKCTVMVYGEVHPTDHAPSDTFCQYLEPLGKTVCIYDPNVQKREAR